MIPYPKTDIGRVADALERLAECAEEYMSRLQDAPANNEPEESQSSVDWYPV